MAVGAYVCALLTMPPELKEMNISRSLRPFPENLDPSFHSRPALGRLAAAFVGFLIGAPVLSSRTIIWP